MNPLVSDAVMKGAAQAAKIIEDLSERAQDAIESLTPPEERGELCDRFHSYGFAPKRPTCPPSLSRRPLEPK
jgi:hypothetical protein